MLCLKVYVIFFYFFLLPSIFWLPRAAPPEKMYPKNVSRGQQMGQLIFTNSIWISFFKFRQGTYIPGSVPGASSFQL